ncbi:MAG TPA: lysine biosynthesis protein LysW [Thermoplasmata archaeon]|nr:lysine biosynthesis protein LysW [Thermoplasmata archaeon]
MTECPECAASVASADKILGEVFPCTDCGTELEVQATEPFSVQTAPKEAEDWGE